MKTGDKFAHYEITGPIGSGAMGEVFSAQDTRLDREVAVKVLPSDFAADPDRLARFRREAKVLASLNHTNIAAIHGLEEENDTIFLAMEMAPGETLEARIDRGPMPIDEALAVAIQIAAGLEEAHAKTIVHRDLKPANVKMSTEGQVKILDFGLARAFEGEDEANTEPGTSPTLTAAMTQAGIILGTAAYMSPEQARGQVVDSRTDIWAFGVVLWELLAGGKLFAGETVTDTLAMVLRSDLDWTALPTDMPPSLRRLLQRCLQRDKRQRLHHMADARIVLEEILQDGTSAYEPAEGSIAPNSMGAQRKSRTGWFVAAVFALLAIGLGGKSFMGEVQPDPTPINLELTLPHGLWNIGDNRQPLAVSPSGDKFVVSLITPQGPQMFMRFMDELELVPIPGTEGATTPFFSPDGSELGFTLDSMLQKISLDGGSATKICRAQWGGGTWTTDGRIVFTKTYASGLSIISDSGGEPQTLTVPDLEHNELGHWWPEVMPDDKWVIYTGYSTPIENARIMALSLETSEQRVLVEGASFGRWSPTGHLVFVRNGKLFAVPFDDKKMAVTGEAETVLEDVFLSNSDGFSPLGFGGNGTLVYMPASVVNIPRNLAMVDRQGEMTALDLPSQSYTGARLSPDGRHIAMSIRDKGNTDIWIHDRRRGTSSRFTFSPSSDFNPVWAPDGRTIIYNGEEPQFTLRKRPADGSSETELMLKKSVDTRPNSISPDGKWLVFTESSVGSDGNIWLMPLKEEGGPRVFLKTAFGEGQGAVSPDGKWLAYASDESGRDEIYAMPFPSGGSRVQISIGGGTNPFWSPLGDELFFQQPSGHMVATIDTERTTATDLVAGRPRVLFEGEGREGLYKETELSPTADGRQFLIVHLPEGSEPTTMRVVVNWFSELQ